MIKKILLLCFITDVSIIQTKDRVDSNPKTITTKEIEIVAPIDFLHDHDSKCFVGIDPIGTVLTRNDMDNDGNIILQESRNSAIIKIPSPKDNIVRIAVNFESSCFINNCEIPFSTLANKGNRINVSENQTTITTIHLKNDRKSKTTSLKNHKVDKNLCTPKNKLKARPNAVVSPLIQPVGKWNQKTVETILHDTKETEEILQTLIEQGYNQDNLTESDLRLPGKLNNTQIQYIMDRLPVFVLE